MDGKLVAFLSPHTIASQEWLTAKRNPFRLFVAETV